MKTENQSCCICFHIASGGNVVTTDILDLMKFLITNLNTNSLENSPICDGCLNKILEASEYKRRNSVKALVETKKEIDCEKTVICQKCKSLCEEGDNFLLVDCVTQIDWSDFVNYLFPYQDSQSLERLQICGSCQISVSNIQDFLKLMYVHDRSKMKCDIDNCDDINVTGNENLVRDKVEIKQEFENFSSDDKTGIQNIIEDKADVEHLAENIKVEMISIDSQGDADITYDNFKCKNEEIELKLESEDGDGQSTDRYENVYDMTSGDDSNFNNEDEEQGVNFQGCSSYDKKVYSNTRDFICIYCSKKFVRKLILDNHLLRIHKCKDGVTSKIYDCQQCNYLTTKTGDISRHKLKHGIKVGLEKYKCQKCVYETYIKGYLMKHVRTHDNIRNFKCTLCSKNFTNKRNLDDHLLKFHKSKDKVTSKIHECDKCSLVTTKKSDLLKHKLKHGTVADRKKTNLL